TVTVRIPSADVEKVVKFTRSVFGPVTVAAPTEISVLAAETEVAPGTKFVPVRTMDCVAFRGIEAGVMDVSVGMPTGVSLRIAGESVMYKLVPSPQRPSGCLNRAAVPTPSS